MDKRFITTGLTLPGEARFRIQNQEVIFRSPREICETHCLAEIKPILAKINRAVEDGAWAAGFLAYEAAPAFDPALVTHPGGDFPLLWFGVYNSCFCTQPESGGDSTFTIGPWEPLIPPDAYRRGFSSIRDYLQNGDTYQVNYTFPLRASFQGDAWAWFNRLCAAQPTNYSAFLNLGRYQIVSVAPELFFRLAGGRLETRPMKGTIHRGRFGAEDIELKSRLQASEKERAENLMIVDLLRNDMGRISEIGSVKVEELFIAERYPTLWQMTSEISSRTSAPLPEIFSALFPCGSVTGAPKVRTMQIIKEIEPYSRGVYCGAIGWWGPERTAQFSVAIRTAVIDTEKQSARYHVGGGIVWDSSEAGEFEECLIKAKVLHAKPPPHFELLESILFDREYFLLKEHLARLKAAADYFGFDIDFKAIVDELRRKPWVKVPNGESRPLKVRLTVGKNGDFKIIAEPVAPLRNINLFLADCPIDEADPFLYHKTTCRRVYEAAKQGKDANDDVLLWNRKGELTESTIANVVFEIKGVLLTPPVECGLLAGVMRAHLLEKGIIKEARVHKDELPQIEKIWLINSVRKWMAVNRRD